MFGLWISLKVHELQIGKSPGVAGCGLQAGVLWRSNFKQQQDCAHDKLGRDTWDMCLLFGARCEDRGGLGLPAVSFEAEELAETLQRFNFARSREKNS